MPLKIHFLKNKLMGKLTKSRWKKAVHDKYTIETKRNKVIDSFTLPCFMHFSGIHTCTPFCDCSVITDKHYYKVYHIYYLSL